MANIVDQLGASVGHVRGSQPNKVVSSASNQSAFLPEDLVQVGNAGMKPVTSYSSLVRPGVSPEEISKEIEALKPETSGSLCVDKDASQPTSLEGSTDLTELAQSITKEL